jgi:hypothetical protein
MSTKLYREVEYIIDQIDTMMWEKTGKEMIGFQWKIGFVLKEVSDDKMEKMCKELGKWFGVSSSFFADSYWIYKNYPVLENAVRCAQ